MDIDYSQLTDAELAAIANNDYSKLSDETLTALSGQDLQSLEPPQVPAYGFSGNAKLPISPIKTAKNIPSSAGRLVGDIGQALTNPVETVQGVGNLALGLVQKIIPDKQEAEKYADAAGQYLMQRYGSMENTLKSIEQDPVGVLSDLSGVITGGATMIPKAGKVAQLGMAIDPINATVNAAKYGAGKALPSTLPAKMYESAAKFSTTLSPKERSGLINTALQEGILPTSEGVTKAQTAIGDLSNRIDTLIAQADQNGVQIPRSAIYQNLREVRQNLGGFRLGASQDLEEVNRIVKEFNDFTKKLGKTSVTPSELQRFKTQAYKSIDFDRSAEKPSIAKQEVYKGMAKAAKTELENAIPEINALNKRQGALLELLPNIQRSAGRIENRDVLGIGTGIKATGGQALGGELGAAAGLAQGILDMPKVKSKAALGLYNLQNKGSKAFLDNSLLSLIARQALINSGRSNPNADINGLLTQD